MIESNENQTAAPTQGEARRPRRRWFRRLFWMVCLLIVLLGVIVAFAPAFISTDAGRRFVLGQVNDSIAGSIDADAVTVRWGRGQSLTGVVVSDPSGTQIVRVGRIELPDASLWSIVQGGLALGELEIDSVEGDITGYADGTTNLARALMPNAPQGRPDATAPTVPTTPSAKPAGKRGGSQTPAVWPSGLSLGVTLRDVDIVYRAEGATEPIRLVIPEAKLSALDPKHMVLELDARLSQGGDGGNRGLEGRARADIRIDDFFDAAGVLQQDRATLDVDAELIDLPIDALDQLTGQGGVLLAVLGPILNGKVQAKLTSNSGFAEIQSDSEHMHIESRLVFDEAGLVSKGPGEIRLTLTPNAWQALNASQADGPTSTLLDPIDIKADLRKLSLPWSEQGLTLNDAGFDLGLTISDTRMKVKDVGEVKLTSLAVELVSDKLSDSVRADIDAGIEYPDTEIDNPRPGSIRSTTTLAGLRFTPEGLDLAGVTYSTETHIQRAPIDLIDTLTQQDGELVGALGPRARVDAVGSYTPGAPGENEGTASVNATGGIDLLLKSRAATIDAKLLVADGRWTLKADAPLSFQVTPRLSQVLLKKVNPFLGGAVSAKLPIKINVIRDGFSAPVRGASLADINADVLLELGDLDLKGEGVLLELLQQLGVGGGSLLNASFSPVTISLAGGKLSYKDLVMSVDKVNFSFSGQVDLNSQRLDLSLSIPGESFAGVSWLKGVIGADQAIVVPLTGTFDKPELDIKLLTREIGKAALQGQLKGVAGDAMGDKIGGDAEAVIGGLLEDILTGKPHDTQADTQTDAAQTQPNEQAQPQGNEVEAILGGLLTELLKDEQPKDSQADKKPLTPEQRKARRKRRRERLARQEAKRQQEQAPQTDQAKDKTQP